MRGSRRRQQGRCRVSGPCGTALPVPGRQQRRLTVCGYPNAQERARVNRLWADKLAAAISKVF